MFRVTRRGSEAQETDPVPNGRSTTRLLLFAEDRIMSRRWFWGILGGSLLGLLLAIAGFVAGIVLTGWLVLPEPGGGLEGAMAFLLCLPLLLLGGAAGGIAGGVCGATLGALWAGKASAPASKAPPDPPPKPGGPEDW
jgi:hypothetical protein